MMTPAHEIEIRKSLAASASDAASAGAVIIPAPIYFRDRADYFAQMKPFAQTQREIETSEVCFCAITLLDRKDSVAEGCLDNPFVRLTYNLYLFHNYAAERADETEPANDFLRATLKSYNRFVALVLNLFAEFTGGRMLAVQTAGIAARAGAPMQPNYIEDNQICRFIPQVYGHAIDLRVTVEVQITDE